MSKDEKKPSIFSKIIEAGEAVLEAQIHKAKSSTVMNKDVDEDDFFYSKALTEEPTYSIHTSGWKEKPTRLQNSHLKQMSLKNTIVAAVIQTRQNQVASHSRLVESEQEKGFMIKLRNEKDLIEEIKVKLREEVTSQQQQQIQQPDDGINKANGDEAGDALDTEQDTNQLSQEQDDMSMDDDSVEQIDWELERKAKEIVRKKFEADKKKVEDYVLNCGKLEKRPFDKKRWNLDSALRAWVRDTYTYDLYATEVVPDNAGRPHYWFPIDAGTVKFASVDLNKYKDASENFVNLDILYPESQAQAIQKQKIIELKQDLLDKNAYKYVQVIRGKIERAYTGDELKIGIRNVTTDIYNNGYGLSELELAVGLVTGHLNAEYYNQAYFTQGFSAKGILHIKAAINRRKLETVRQQWQHMVRGSKNSFQTPIFAGVEEVKWVPLTQSHQDIGFEGWIRYLIKVTCAIFQIDPHEIGIGFKDEGPGGGVSSGDNTQEKLKQSKDKGLVPLLRHLENYINEEILKPFDDRFCLKFTGISSESRSEVLDRQEKEVKFKKTVNEIRSEDGLPPIPGMDGIILSQEFLQWYSQFSSEAKKMAKEAMSQQPQQGMTPDQNEEDEFVNFDENSLHNEENIDSNLLEPEMSEDMTQKSLRKSKKPTKVKIEYYKVR